MTATEDCDILVGIPTVRRPSFPGEPLLHQVVRSLLNKPRPKGLRLEILVYNLDREPEQHEAAQQLPALVRELGGEGLVRIEVPANRHSVRPYEVKEAGDPNIPRHPRADHPWQRWQRQLTCDRILLLERMAERSAWGYLMLEDDCALCHAAGWQRLASAAPEWLRRCNGVLRLRSYSHFPRIAALCAPKSGATSILFDADKFRDYLGQLHHSMLHRQGTQPIDILLDQRRPDIDKHRLYLFRHIGGQNSTNLMRAHNRHTSLLKEDWDMCKSVAVYLLARTAPKTMGPLINRWRKRL